MDDDRQYAPATLRNRDFILDVLRDVLPMTGIILEIASGSGEHIVHFARNFPALVFQPSDPEPDALLSIAAWVKATGVTNVRAPIALDASHSDWPIASADGIICINMVHISPWEATLGLIKGAAAILPPASPFYLYGPYIREGFATAPSNQAFDRSLRDRNPRWGLRHLEAVAAMAQSNGFSTPIVTEMPANNLSVLKFRSGCSSEHRTGRLHQSLGTIGSGERTRPLWKFRMLPEDFALITAGNARPRAAMGMYQRRPSRGLYAPPEPSAGVEIGSGRVQ